MEFIRNSALDYGSLVIFLGFIFSNSLIPLGLTENTTLFPLSTFSNLFFLCLTCLITLGSFVYYLLSKYSIFFLEISEYILLPINLYFLIRLIKTEQVNSNLNELSLLSIIMIGLSFIMVFTILVKIFAINQLFYTNPYKRIGSFRLIARVYRVFRMIASVPALYFLDPEVSRIIIYCLNGIQFSLVLTIVGFLKLKHESALLFANFNVIGSIIIYQVSRSFFDYPIVGASQLLCFALYFAQPAETLFHVFMALKYRSVITTINAEQVLTKRFDSENTFTVLLEKSLFIELIKEIILRENGHLWPVNFVTWLRNIYIRISLVVLLKNQSKEVGDRRTDHEITKQICQIYKSSDYLVSEIDLCLQDKNLLFKVMNEFLNPHLILAKSEYNEICFYYISEIIPESPHFVLQSLILYFKSRSIKSDGYLADVRNKKLRAYIDYFMDIYHLQDGKELKFIGFQKKFKQLSQQIIDAAQQEMKLVQIYVNPQADFNLEKQKLVERYHLKKKIKEKFQSLFKQQEYLKSSDFLFLYILFRVIFCKSVEFTKVQIREKFLIPKFNQIKLKQIQQLPLLLCVGIKYENEEVGSILLTNKIFRKQFNFKSVNETSNIANLIQLNQKQEHITLMEKSMTFDEIKQRQHHSYKCYLKSNLKHDAYTILRVYEVDTKIYYGCNQSLRYFCSFRSKKQFEDFVFIPEKQIKKIKKYNDPQISEKKTVQIQQLGQQFKAKQIPKHIIDDLLKDQQDEGGDSLISDDEALEKLNISLEIQGSVNMESQIDTIENNLNFLDMEACIQTNNLDHSKLIKYLIISFILLILMFLFVQVSFYFIGRELKEPQNNIESLQNYLKSSFNQEISLSLFFIILNGIDEGRVDNKICEKGFLINDLEKYLRFHIITSLNEKLEEVQDSGLGDYQNKDIVELFAERVYQFEQFQHESLMVSYSKYIFTLKSFALQAFNINKNEQAEEDHEKYEQVLTSLTTSQNYFSENSFFSHFQSMIQKQFQHLEKIIEILQILGLMAIALFILLFFVFYLKAKWIEINYYLLLQNMKKQFFQRRVCEMNFICNEIYSLEKKNSHDFFLGFDETFSLGNEDTLKKQERLEIHQVQTLIDYSDAQHFESFNKAEKKFQISKIVRLLVTFRIALILLILITCSGIVFYEQMIQNFRLVAERIQVLENYTIQNGKIKESLLNLLVVNWMEKQKIYRSSEKNKQIFNIYFDYLTQRNSQKQLFQSFHPEFMNYEFNQSLCNHKQIQYPQICKEYKNGLLDIGIFQMISTLYKISYYTHQHLENQSLSSNSELIEGYLCENLLIYFNYTEPIINSNNDHLIEYEKQKENENEKNLEILFYATGVLSIIFVFLIFLRMFYMIVTIVGHQVLTFDTPKNLYTHENFRPYLNALINKIRQ